MLIQARRVGEELLIAGVIRVKVLSITGSIVRLAFDAPDGIRIERVTPPGRPGELESKLESKP